MEKLNTKATINKVSSTVKQWLREDNRGAIIGACSSHTLRTSNPAIRDYLDSLLDFLTSYSGTDSEKLLGYYSLYSKEGKSYVTLKRSSAKIPRTLDKFIEWVEWDVPKNAATVAQVGYIKHLFWHFSGTRYPWLRRPYYHKLHLCSLSHALLQALFGPGYKVDLSSKLLPTDDLRCRLGKYTLLYDHLAEEWRIWKKS